MENDRMHFDDELEMYVIEVEGVIFAFEDDPNYDYEESMRAISQNYWGNLDSIIQFMMPYLQEMYGDINEEIVREKLGKPTVYIDNCQVEYYEQSFDDMHIFSFEFMDNDFKKLQYFSVDG
jgi:hypothetical protein